MELNASCEGGGQGLNAAFPCYRRMGILPWDGDPCFGCWLWFASQAFVPYSRFQVCALRGLLYLGARLRSVFMTQAHMRVCLRFGRYGPARSRN